MCNLNEPRFNKNLSFLQHPQVKPSFLAHFYNFAGLKVVGEVQKVGKSRNFQPKVGKSRNFSAFKVGILLVFLSLFCILLCLICLFHW